MQGGSRREAMVRVAKEPYPPRTLAGTVSQIGVAALFRLIAPVLTRVHIARSPDVTYRAGMLVVFNHKRDTDIPLLVHALFGPSVWLSWLGRLTFAGKSDIFLRGFLALQFSQLGPLGRWLYQLDITPALRLIRIVRVRKAGPRLVAEWITELVDVFGADRPADELLRPEWRATAAAGTIESGVAIGRLLDWRYHALLSRLVGPELLQEPVLRRLQMHEAREAVAKLDELESALVGGDLLVMAPEGNLTADGRLQPLRSGAVRLLERVPGSVVLPTSITYDLLCSGRPAAFIRIGSPVANLGALPRREREARLRAEMLALTTVTLAQIVARLVFEECAGSTGIGRAALARRAFDEARRIAATGRPIDATLVVASSFDRRFETLLHQARDRGLRVEGDRVQFDRELLRRPVESWSENPLGYAYNELRSTYEAGESEEQRAEERRPA